MRVTKFSSVELGHIIITLRVANFSRVQLGDVKSRVSNLWWVPLGHITYISPKQRTSRGLIKLGYSASTVGNVSWVELGPRGALI